MVKVYIKGCLCINNTVLTIGLKMTEYTALENFGEIYHNVDPEVYISSTFFENAEYNKIRKFIFQQLHELFKSGHNLKVLDVGSGPGISFSISVAQYASEIVLSDYSDNFRSALQKWVDCDSTAHDWTAYFKYVVEDLEGKSEKEAKERETQLHRAITAVVPCDITKDPPLPPEYMDQYDLVTSILCLEAACRSKNEYKAAVARLYNLVKPGGRIAIQGVEKDETLASKGYKIGQQGFWVLPITREFIKATLEGVGFSDIRMTPATRDDLKLTPGAPPSMKAFVFFSARKN